MPLIISSCDSPVSFLYASSKESTCTYRITSFHWFIDNVIPLCTHP
jgi:hypothetical protein